MKKNIIFLIVLVLLQLGIHKTLDDFNFYIVGHTDVGSYLNGDELDDERATMLHFYSSKIIVRSDRNKPISFVKFDLKSPFNMYINKYIVVQNHMKNYDKYMNENYIKYTIGSGDYINGEAVTDIDIVPSTKNHYATFFAGNDIQINRLIIFKHTVSFAIILLICIAAIIGLAVNYQNKWFVAFCISFFIIFVDFEAGLIILSTLMYFVSGSILRKKHNITAFMVMSFLGVFIIGSTEYLLLLLLLLFYRLFHSYSYKTVATLFSLGLLFSVHIYDYEFDFFRMFYKEIHLIPFIVFIVLMSYKRFVQKNEKIGVELLRGINHDFKIPLSVLKLNNEMLHSNRFETEAKRNALLNSSSDAIKTLENMLSSINAFLSNTSYVSKKYNTSILDCIEKTQNIFRRKDKKVELFVHCDTKDTLLPIDSVWLERLIFNLLDNAYKYTDDYGTITLTYKKEKHFLLLSVEDTGIGMTKEELQKITMPFYRADKSRSVSGLGLGLSIVKNIIDQVKGELTIHSTPGVGTTVTVKI
ncbi:HAMP domain-containing sensor histidine kinase [Petroclostridium sp. X23]|uniref:sensor histidine kinase n=1 Tax=Petroclostridium sp. X23 TaxID=3045146 RepID=UPI0024ACEF4F|nr:HAMP domain-containing sensor histidine kinase [Petroclostridium sp. X23]WHH60959.1 HAMP domain-containing sensor histidine kinase [Petroclostridium sp. X23]